MLNNRLIQALMGLLPFTLFVINIVYCFAYLFPSFAVEQGSYPSQDMYESVFSKLGNLILLSLFSMVVIIISIVYFIIHALHNPNLNNSNARIIWILVIVLVNTFGGMIYWLAEIVAKKPKPIVR